MDESSRRRPSMHMMDDSSRRRTSVRQFKAPAESDSHSMVPHSMIPSRAKTPPTLIKRKSKRVNFLRHILFLLGLSATVTLFLLQTTTYRGLQPEDAYVYDKPVDGTARRLEANYFDDIAEQVRKQIIQMEQDPNPNPIVNQHAGGARQTTVKKMSNKRKATPRKKKGGLRNANQVKRQSQADTRKGGAGAGKPKKKGGTRRRTGPNQQAARRP